jgi:hypothetical protein
MPDERKALTLPPNLAFRCTELAIHCVAGFADLPPDKKRTPAEDYVESFLRAAMLEVVEAAGKEAASLERVDQARVAEHSRLTAVAPPAVEAPALLPPDFETVAGRRAWVNFAQAALCGELASETDSYDPGPVDPAYRRERVKDAARRAGALADAMMAERGARLLALVARGGAA